jgi:hypothetical protein
MRKYWPAVLLVSAAMAIPAHLTAQDAQQTGAPKVAATVEAAVGTSVADRALVGAAEMFKADAGKLYCFTKVSDAADSDIEHVWYKDDTEMGRVKLHIAGSPWRTHSSKKLGENPAGNWRCDVVQDGKVLKSVTFKVE